MHFSTGFADPARSSNLRRIRREEVQSGFRYGRTPEVMTRHVQEVSLTPLHRGGEGVRRSSFRGEVVPYFQRQREQQTSTRPQQPWPRSRSVVSGARTQRPATSHRPLSIQPQQRRSSTQVATPRAGGMQRQMAPGSLRGGMLTSFDSLMEHVLSSFSDFGFRDFTFDDFGFEGFGFENLVGVGDFGLEDALPPLFFRGPLLLRQRVGGPALFPLLAAGAAAPPGQPLLAGGGGRRPGQQARPPPPSSAQRPSAAAAAAAGRSRRAVPSSLPYDPADYLLPPGVGMDEAELWAGFRRRGGEEAAARRGRAAAAGAAGAAAAARGGWATPRGGEDYEALLALDDALPPRRALSPRSKRRLNVFQVTNQHLLRAKTKGNGTEKEAWLADPNEGCVICREPYRRGQRVVRLPCSHGFHEGCVLRWFELSNSCPTCRTEVHF